MRELILLNEQLEKAIAFVKGEKQDEAHKVLDGILERMESSNIEDRNLSVKARNLKGNLLFADKRYEEALTFYQRNLEGEKKDAVSLYHVACIMSILGRSEEMYDTIHTLFRENNGFWRMEDKDYFKDHHNDERFRDMIAAAKEAEQRWLQYQDVLQKGIVFTDDGWMLKALGYGSGTEPAEIMLNAALYPAQGIDRLRQEAENRGLMSLDDGPNPLCIDVRASYKDVSELVEQGLVSTGLCRLQ